MATLFRVPSLPRSPSPFDRAAIGLGPTAAFVLALAATWILPVGPLTAFFGALLTAYMLLTPARANGAALRLVLPFLAMGVWGLALAQGNDTYIVNKDFWYAGKVALCLALGFLIGIRPANERRIAQALIGLSAVMALVTIVLWWRSGASLNEFSSDEEVHLLPLVATVAIVPLLDEIRQRTGAPRAWAGVILGLILLGIVVSNSRITLISGTVMVLAWAGLFSRTTRALLGGAVVVGALALLWHFLPEYNGGELTVALKLRRSLDEILLTDSTDPTEMVLNWRGFEAYNAQWMFDQASIFRKLFGHGLGSVVDLGQDIDLGDGEIHRFIPILHNGFYYILTKYGLVGILVYLWGIFRIGTISRYSPDNLALPDRMLRGAIVTALLSTMVITGLYNKTELNALTLLLGWLAGFAQRRLYDQTIALAAEHT